MWWLPKSYWPVSLKYYMINPYLLSCIGLMLGIRVTKCFWNNLTDMFLIITGGKDSTFWAILEYGVLKAPICTMVISSFLFSFSKVYFDYGTKAVIYFTIPLLVYIILLWTGYYGSRELKKPNLREEKAFADKFVNMFLKIHSYFVNIGQANTLINPEITEHLCVGSSKKIRAEVDHLIQDFCNRLKYSIYAGFSTAYLSIYLPIAFLPKPVYGMPQYLLINEIWITKVFIIVVLTSFSVYFTYLLPLNYLNLLQKAAFHLGRWEEVEKNQAKEFVPFSDEILYPASEKVTVSFNNRFYKVADSKNAISTVAIPGNTAQFLFFRIASDPVRFVTFLCLFEFTLIVFQFSLLIMTSDWQHIVTLVLLMFANYLLLGKLFKDRVVVGRIYNPSGEDVDLWKQMSLNLDETSPKKLLDFIGRPVEIDVAPLTGKKSDTSVTGNIVTIDPESKSVCLVQFYHGIPSHSIYVPGTSVLEVHDLTEGPFDDVNLNYVKNTPELMMMINEKFRKKVEKKNYSEEEIERRRSRLLAKLEYSCVKHEVLDDGKTVLVGAVKIRAPFEVDSCFSENQLALGRVRKLVESVFDGTAV
ncbi:hypothetical protein FO519_004009 [Halicephalobus sp. NKZ332]|nr:hypothetical protein FO519_004009 [Halicephalobus sp. NKZ332]